MGFVNGLFHVGNFHSIHKYKGFELKMFKFGLKLKYILEWKYVIKIAWHTLEDK